MRVEYEGGDRAQDEFVRGMREVLGQAKLLRGGVDENSAAYSRLTNIIGQGTRNITTAEGQISKLGLSQQVALGNTNRLTSGIRGLGTGIVGLGNVLPGVIGVAGLGGLLSVSANLAKQADKTAIAQQVINATIERTGNDANSV